VVRYPVDYGIHESAKGNGSPTAMTQPTSKSGLSTVLWIVVALAALATAVVITALAFADEEITKPLLVAFFGIISTSIPAIIALYKVNDVQVKVSNGNGSSPVVNPLKKGGE
jgi:anti-sigma-K factor RskA